MNKSRFTIYGLRFTVFLCLCIHVFVLNCYSVKKNPSPLITKKLIPQLRSATITDNCLLITEKTHHLSLITNKTLNPLPFTQKAPFTLKTDSLKIKQKLRFEKAIASFKLDKLGNIYAITTQNELIKFDSKGNWISNYRAKVFGEISTLDCSNPLEIILFYPDVAQILRLDNMLLPQSTIEISELNLGDNSVLCRSFDNNFWLYDERNFQVKKIAVDLRTVIEGTWLQNQFQESISPNFILEHQENVYLNSPDLGILVFDLYGVYLKTFPIKNLDFFQIHQQELFFIEGKKLKAFHLMNFTERTIPIPENIQPKHFFINQKGVFILNENNEILDFSE